MKEGWLRVSLATQKAFQLGRGRLRLTLLAWRGLPVLNEPDLRFNEQEKQTNGGNTFLQDRCHVIYSELLS